MISKRAARPILVALAGVGLVACGASVEKDATYGSVEDLRKAVLTTDLDCPGDKVITVENGGGEIRCTSDVTLGVYENEDDRSTLMVGTALFSERHALEGPNWVITGPDEVALGKVRDKLGGELQINSK